MHLRRMPGNRPARARTRRPFRAVDPSTYRAIRFDYVLAKVVPVMFVYDTAMHAAFGSGKHSTEANTVASLQSYIDELRGLPIDLLMAGH
jgi:hypothetical protein